MDITNWDLRTFDGRHLGRSEGLSGFAAFRKYMTAQGDKLDGPDPMVEEAYDGSLRIKYGSQGFVVIPVLYSLEPVQ